VRQHTNMVFIEPRKEDLEPLRLYLEERQILFGYQPPPIRLVVHLDIDDDAIERAIEAIRSYYR
jgi:threonine aldolase